MQHKNYEITMILGQGAPSCRKYFSKKITTSIVARAPTLFASSSPPKSVRAVLKAANCGLPVVSLLRRSLLCSLFFWQGCADQAVAAHRSQGKKGLGHLFLGEIGHLQASCPSSVGRVTGRRIGGRVGSDNGAKCRVLQCVCSSKPLFLSIDTCTVVVRVFGRQLMTRVFTGGR